MAMLPDDDFVYPIGCENECHIASTDFRLVVEHHEWVKRHYGIEIHTVRRYPNGRGYVVYGDRPETDHTAHIEAGRQQDRERSKQAA